ncbi:ribosomal-processing cysteine protease Prp [Oceanispirochaeta sp.]|uniref:ribosomal-processing cysteine protease Prp n=1 Tax=Oceanispirochaeta sp. TaxID=2035350 RepID=UPI00261957ED|nr:ribosomal-processing cysteine protease Prp [Oceanispirochaeta sp.]MDA3955324.1 ribosomal-processing cysteine protease Prp [Oceanispirochaeta sp.]
MIEIVLTFRDSGLLETLISRGHANRTADLPNEACAAVSVLLRTAARLFSHTDGVSIIGGAEKPGHLELKVLDVPEQHHEWFRGAVDLLMLGLRDLQEEYPDSIQIRTDVRKR